MIIKHSFSSFLFKCRVHTHISSPLPAVGKYGGGGGGGGGKFAGPQGYQTGAHLDSDANALTIWVFRLAM